MRTNTCVCVFTLEFIFRKSLTNVNGNPTGNLTRQAKTSLRLFLRNLRPTSSGTKTALSTVSAWLTTP